MEQRTKTRVAAIVAIGCALGALAWKMTRPIESKRTSGAGGASSASGDTSVATGTTTSAATQATSGAASAPTPHLDRKHADEMREKIRALLAEAGPAWGTTDAVDASSASAAAAAGLYPEMPSGDQRDDAGMSETGKYIQKRVREDLFPLAKQCYAQQLEKNPKLAGRFVMHFRIVGDRRVGGVVDTATMDPSSTLSDPEFSRCMTESMMSVSFDAPPGKSGQVTVTYPIEFSPDDDDAGDAQ